MEEESIGTECGDGETYAGGEAKGTTRCELDTVEVVALKGNGDPTK